jgi:hypothetical protein
MIKLLLICVEILLTAGIAAAQPGTPLAGSYDIAGGNNDYATLTAATSALTGNGISGKVTFNLYPDTLYEPLELWSITGASVENTVTFQSAPSYYCTIVSDTTPNVHLNGSDYVILRDFGVNAETTGECVRLDSDANNNVMSNLNLCGVGYIANAYGIRITGGGNDNNLVDSVTIDSCQTGISFMGTLGSPDLNNIVCNSKVNNGVECVQAGYQDGVRIHNNDLQPGYPGSVALIWGIRVYAQLAGDTCRIYANDIHNFRTTGNSSYGVWVDAAALTSYTLVYNNFIYDWAVSGVANERGLYQVSGKVAFDFNSVRIDDTPTTGNGICCYVNANPTTLSNNIFQVDDANITSFGIYRSTSATSTQSDYNCFYSTSPTFNVGYAGGANRQSLAQWQGFTGQDFNSRQGNPGFISTTDLHISSSATFVNGVGTTIPLLDRDHDGTLRGSPPDIGADEYETGPMHGGYDIAGGNMDYTDIPSAVADLSIRGINAPVLFNVYPGWMYLSAGITLASYAGVTAADTIV